MSRQSTRQSSAKVLPPQRLSAQVGRSAAMPSGPASVRVWGVCLGLALLVWAVFGQTLHFAFVNYDDNRLQENPMVARGLSLEGVGWAFTHTLNDNWHPLTTLSHMADCQLYGLKPAGHHFTNVLLHGATVLLLFLFLRRSTGTFWRSAFVAAVFAIHPLRAESVAWVSERKDVLSGLFFVLTLWAYTEYARKVEGRGPGGVDGGWRMEEGLKAGPGSRLNAQHPTFNAERSTLHAPRSTSCYLLALLLFALGLMSKPMLVTVPFVLLLLDYWPLQRFPIENQKSKIKILLEKLPFLLFSALDCLATVLAQRHATMSVESLGFSTRLGNAQVAYVAYLRDLFYPAGLAVFYPHPGSSLSLWAAAGAAFLLAAISMGVWVSRRRQPWLLVGWLWYLGMLVPVIGLMQVGSQARADRYTYLPQLGLAILVAWSATAVCGGSRRGRQVLRAVAAAIVVALLACGRVQTAYWQNSATLWQHAVDCTASNPLAHNDLALALAEQGKVAEAIAQDELALQLKPDYAEVDYNLANLLGEQGRWPEAVEHYRRALRLLPNYAEAHYNLGNALSRLGDLAEAIREYERALQLKPDYGDAHNNLGLALAARGETDAAIAQYRQAAQLEPQKVEAQLNWGNALAAQGKLAEALAHYEQAAVLKPDSPEAHYDLGNAWSKAGELPQAVEQYDLALKLRPDYPEAHANLGGVLVRQGNAAAAIPHYQRALELKPQSAEAHYNLGNALALQGDSAEAAREYQQALSLAQAQHKTALAAAVEARLAQLESSKATPLPEAK